MLSIPDFSLEIFFLEISLIYRDFVFIKWGNFLKIFRGFHVFYNSWDISREYNFALVLDLYQNISGKYSVGKFEIGSLLEIEI